MADSVSPQFRIQLPPAGDQFAWGTQVTFNGQQVCNVVSVKAENTASVDELVRSVITIELVGEAVIIETAGGGSKV